jgi:hypothetical protein
VKVGSYDDAPQFVIDQDTEITKLSWSFVILSQTRHSHASSLPVTHNYQNNV